MKDYYECYQYCENLNCPFKYNDDGDCFAPLEWYADCFEKK